MSFHVGLPQILIDACPLMRSSFFRSAHGRARLRTTHEILALVLTYHQVMPGFLDYVYPFGWQDYPRDMYCGGFQAQCHFGDPCNEIKLPQLGRSGRYLELCYHMKSAEENSHQEDWPWSIRHASLYLSFDVETGRSTYILIEAGSSLRHTLSQATGHEGLPEVKDFTSREKAFASNLAVQLLVCEWSARNWRWYFDFLEQRCQGGTREFLAQPVQHQGSPAFNDLLSLFSRSNTQDSLRSPQSSRPRTRNTCRRFSFSSRTQQMAPLNENEPSVGPRPTQIRQASVHGNPPSAEAELQTTEADTAYANSMNGLRPEEDHKLVKFEELQSIQHIEEAIHEAALILKLNVNVQEQLTAFLSTLSNKDRWPQELTESCKLTMDSFESRMRLLINGQQMQMARGEMLLRLLADRKSLVSETSKPYQIVSDVRGKAHGIFNAQNMIFNRDMALHGNVMSSEAVKSTRKMEAMTNDMNAIANKTKRETVWMRIITLITLFFLPGTFISVREKVRSACCSVLVTD